MAFGHPSRIQLSHRWISYFLSTMTPKSGFSPLERSGTKGRLGKALVFCQSSWKQDAEICGGFQREPNFDRCVQNSMATIHACFIWTVGFVGCLYGDSIFAGEIILLGSTTKKLLPLVL